MEETEYTFGFGWDGNTQRYSAQCHQYPHLVGYGHEYGDAIAECKWMIKAQEEHQARMSNESEVIQNQMLIMKALKELLLELEPASLKRSEIINDLHSEIHNIPRGGK
jgi:hypothetical protein